MQVASLLKSSKSSKTMKSPTWKWFQIFTTCFECWFFTSSTMKIKELIRRCRRWNISSIKTKSRLNECSHLLKYRTKWSCWRFSALEHRLTVKLVATFLNTLTCLRNQLKKMIFLCWRTTRRRELPTRTLFVLHSFTSFWDFCTTRRIWCCARKFSKNAHCLSSSFVTFTWITTRQSRASSLAWQRTFW